MHLTLTCVLSGRCSFGSQPHPEYWLCPQESFCQVAISGGKQSARRLSKLLHCKNCANQVQAFRLLDEMATPLVRPEYDQVYLLAYQVCVHTVQVSLKEGLFNNANVIYRYSLYLPRCCISKPTKRLSRAAELLLACRTRFVDGVSTVTRTANNTERWGREFQPFHIDISLILSQKAYRRQALDDCNIACYILVKQIANKALICSYMQPSSSQREERAPVQQEGSPR